MSIYLFGRGFKLYGATLWNGGHYICLFYFKNNWHMYDGRKGSGFCSLPAMFCELLGFTLSFVVNCSQIMGGVWIFSDQTHSFPKLDSHGTNHRKIIVLSSFFIYIYISDWIYKKIPPNAGTIIIIQHVQMHNKGLALSLNNATCRLHSHLTADYNYITRLCHRTTDYD